MASIVSFSLHPPPMTTRQRTRNVAEPYLKYVVDPPILDVTQSQPIKVKESLRAKFELAGRLQMQSRMN